MRFNTLVLLPALAIGAVPASAQSRISADTALASLVAAERAFAAHSMDISTQGAFQAWLADNAVLYRPRAVRAHEYLRARPMPQSLVLGWEPVFADVAAAGDLGYTTGPWIASNRERRDVQPTFGEYVTLWRRQADGSWKAEVDAGIAHEADPVGPTGLETAPAPKWRGSRSDAAGALRSLLAADSAFAADAQRNGVEAAFLKRLTPHARLLRNGRYPLKADSAAAFLRATPGYTWKVVNGGVSQSGDLGYTFGAYVYLVPGEPRQATEGGDYLRIWRRDETGAWRVALDLTSPAQ